MLGEVEETIYTVDEEDEGGNGEVRTVKKQSEMLFVRGELLCCFGRLFWGKWRLITFADDLIQATPWSSFRLSNNHLRLELGRYTSKEGDASKAGSAKGRFEHGTTNMHTGTNEDWMD